MKNKLAVLLAVTILLCGFTILSNPLFTLATPDSGYVWIDKNKNSINDDGDFNTTTITWAVGNASSGDVIYVQSGTYEPFIVSGMVDLTIVRELTHTVVVKGRQSVATNYANRDAVIFVENSMNITLEGLDIEGQGLGTVNPKSYGVIYENSSGTIRDCIVSPNTVGDMSSTAIGAWDGSDLTVDPCTIKNFGRIGVFYFNNCSGGVYNSTIIGQVYTDINKVCYGIEVEAYDYACDIEIIGNEIYNCDNTNVPPTWTSAGIVIDGWLGEFYTPSSTVVIEENNIHDNYIGIEVVANALSHAYYNNIYNNTAYGVCNDPDYANNSVTFDARYNWWGDPTGPYHAELNPSGKGDTVSDNVKLEPWLIEAYPPATPVEALLYVDPAKVELWTPYYSKNFTVEVKIGNVTNLYGYEFKLYWNTSLLDLVGIDATPIWSPGHYVVAKNETDEASGKYWLAIGAFDTSAVNGSKTLAKLTFKVTYDPIYPENKTCPLDLASTKLTAPNGVVIYHMVHDGKYSIYSTKPKIKVDPSTYVAHALTETTFTVNITVSDIVNLYEFAFKLSYNTTILDVTNLEIGAFLKSPYHIHKYVVDDENGYVWLWISSTGAASANGTGILATITFKAAMVTTWTQKHSNILSCSLHLYDTVLKTNLGVEVAHDLLDGMYTYEPKPGDLDYDGHVGLTDLRIVAYYYDPAYNSIADLNEDGVVDIYDMSIVSNHYGTDC